MNIKKNVRKKINAFRNKPYRKVFIFWLMGSVILGSYGAAIFTFRTPEAQAATSNIAFTTEADYTQEDVKGTVGYYTQSSGVKGNLKVSSGGANVDISSTKIKHGCRAIVAGTSRKIISISDASLGLINFGSAVSSGAITAIYCTTFNGSVVELGTGSVATSLTAPLTTGGAHRMAFDPTDNIIIISAVGQNLVKKFITSTETLASDIGLTHGSFDVVYDGTNNVFWVTDNGYYNINRISPVSGTVLSTYSSTYGAAYGAYASTEAKFFFTAVGNKVKRVLAGVINETGITVGSGPRNMAYDPSNGTIWVSNNSTNTVSVVNASTEVVTATYTVGNGPGYIAYDPTQNVMWVANDTDNTVKKVNISDGSVAGTYSLGDGGQYGYTHSIAYDSASNSVWISSPMVSNVVRLNAATGSVIGTYTASGAGPIAYDVNSQSIWGIDILSNNLIRLVGDTPSGGTGYTVTTGASTRINAATWYSLNSATATETKDSQTAFYAISFNAGHTYKIWTGSAWRTIASDLAAVHGNTDGVWYYQNVSSLWVAATGAANANSAISDAITSSGGSINSMTGTVLGAMSSANWSASGGFVASGSATIDVATFISSTSGFSNPTVDNIVFDYSTAPVTPTVQFSIAAGNAAESVTPAVATVTLSTASASDVSVDYVITGTATYGTDFTPTSTPGHLTISAGLTSGTISLPIVDDAIDESDETMVLTIYSSVNATLGTPTGFTYTINDNDAAPAVQFAAATSSDSEGNNPVAIPVTLSAVSGQTVTVNYAVTGGTATGTGTDYTLTSGTLTYPAGSTTQYIPVALVDDTLGESNETIILGLSTPSNATLGATASSTFTINDNDAYPSVQFSLTNSVAAEGTTPNIAVALSKAPAVGQDVTVSYAVTGGTAVSGTNYTLASGTITLTSTAPVNISPVTIADSDTIDQSLVLTLSSPINAILGVNTTHALTIREPFLSEPPRTITELAVNGKPTPATVATSSPVFGWHLPPTIEGDSQTAYRFTLASSESNLLGGIYICNTGEITSNVSVIDYGSACNSTLYAGTFYWRVFAYNTNHTESVSATQTLTISSTIATPTACSVGSVTSSGVTLTWADNASDETGVEVEQSLSTTGPMSDGNYHRIATTAANAISYDVTGLSPNVTYFYRVRAINDFGYSSYIACTSTVATLAVTPNAPIVTPVSTTSLHIKINPNQNSDATTYAIGIGSQFLQGNMTLSSTPDYQSTAYWGSGSGISISSLTPNTGYVINITAQNSNAIATSASISTTAYTLADKPVVSTSSPSTSGFSVSLTAGSNPVGGTLIAIQIYDGILTRYVQANGTLGDTPVKQTVSTWGTRTVTGLVPSRNYVIQAIAYNGDTNEIPTYSYTAAQYTAADAPTSFRVEYLSTTRADLYTDTRSGYNYGFNGVAPTASNTVTNSSLTNNGSTANQTVLLNNGADTSTVTMGICSAVVVPGTPTQDDAARTATSATVILTVDANAAATEYQIIDMANNLYVSPLGILTSTPTWATRANFGGSSGIAIKNLSTAQDYLFEVRARNCQNIMTDMSSFLVVQLPAAAPLAPTVTALSGTANTSSAQLIINTTGLSQIANLTFAIYDATTNQYVQNTLASSTGNGELGATAVWKSYDNWGGTVGYTVNGLSPNITNSFAVKARKTVGITTTDTGFSAKADLVTGANMSVISAGSITTSRIALQFNTLGNAISTTQYSIELVPPSGPSTYLVSGGTNNTFGAQSWATLSAWDAYDGATDNLVTISGLISNTAYNLRTKARNSDNTEGYRSPIATNYTASAPTSGMTATATSTTRINLTWGVADNPVGTEYLVSYGGQYVVSNALSGTRTWSTYDNLPTTNTTYVDGLTPNTQYCFVAISRNVFLAESQPTGSVCATTASDTPSGVTATATSSSHIDLTWVTGSNPTGTEYLITSGAQYVVANALSGTLTWSTFDNTVTTNTTHLDGLTPNTQYCFTVKSRDSSLIESSPTGSVCATTASSMPTSVTATATSSSHINISWGTDSNPIGTEYLIGIGSQYVVSYALSGTLTWSTFDNLPTTNTTHLDGLTPNTQYCVIIKSRNSLLAESSPTGSVCATTPSIMPTGVTATTASSTRVNLTWGMAGNPIGTEYLISTGSQYVVTNALSATPTWSTFDNLTPTNATYVDGLSTGTEYCFTIKSRNALLTESSSTGSVCTTTTFDTPTAVTATATSSSHIDLSWGVSTNPIGTQYLISTGSQYVVANALSGTATWSTFDNLPTTNTTHLDGLTPNTQYCFTIKGRSTTLVESTPATPVCATTASAMPASVTPTATSTANINLTWDVASNPIGTEYLVSVSSQAGSQYVVSNGLSGTLTWSTFDNVPTTNTTHLDGLTANTQYCFILKSRNATLVESSPTGSVCATTQGGSSYVPPPTGPGDITNCYDTTLTTRYASSECTTGRTTCSDVSSSWFATASCTALRAAIIAWTPPVASVTECNNTSSTIYSSAECVAMRAAAVVPVDFTNCYDATNVTRFASSVCTTARADCINTSSPSYSTASCLALRVAMAAQVPVVVVETPTKPEIPVEQKIIPPPEDKKIVDNTQDTKNTGGGTATVFVTPEELKKQLDEFKKQKDEGLLTFQIGDVKKEIQVDGETKTATQEATKAETGITREEFIVALVGSVDLKQYSSTAEDKKVFDSKDPIQIADKLEITNAFIEDTSGTYDKTKFITKAEALQAFFLAANVSEAEACAKKIFKECSISNPDEKLTKADLTSYLDSLKKYIIAQSVQKTNTDKIDTDKDGISDWKEANIYNTDPTKKDTDSDKLNDGDEINKYHTDPLKADTDGDELSDGQEINGTLNEDKKLVKTNPLKADTDGDTFSDKQEINGVLDEAKNLQKTDPLDPLSFPTNTKVEKGTGDRDEDGLCDLCETKTGTDPDKADTDGDELIDSVDPEPLVFNIKNAPVKILITNLPSNSKAASSPFMKGSAPANSIIAIIAKNEYGLKREIARVQTSENNQFAAELRPLPNGDFYLLAQNIDSGETSPQIKVTIDSSLQPEVPSLESIDDLPFTSEDTSYIPEVTASPTIKAKLLKGKAVITFKSAIGTSTLISDSSTGELEIRPPEHLEIGDHEVIAYSVQEDGNIISPIVKYKFRVTESSSLSNEDFRIKMRNADGLVSFLRQRTVGPLFQKIFIGLGIVLVLWLAITTAQAFRKKKRRK